MQNDGSVTFICPKRSVACQLNQVWVVSVFLSAPDSIYPVRFQTPTGWVRVCRQLTGVEQLVRGVKAANPEVELRGSASDLIRGG